MKNKRTKKHKIEVSAEVRLGETDPACEITLSIVDGSSSVKMSPVEARELARQLLDVQQTPQTVKERPPPHEWLSRELALLIDNQAF